MEQFNIISNYLKIRENGWTILIHKQFHPTDLISLVRDKPANADDHEQDRVGSSDMARVYRRSINVNTQPVAVYVKEYLTRSLFDTLKHLFRPSRAMRSFSAGIMLQANGLHSPKIAAIFEKRDRVFCNQNIMVTCEMENARAVYTFFENDRHLESRDILSDRRNMIIELGKTIGRMHAAGISHGDLRGGNIFALKESSRWHFYFIDNERTVKHRHLPNRLRKKNLIQLNMLQYNITHTDRMRFFKAYRDAAGLDTNTAKNIAYTVHKKTSLRVKKRARVRMALQDPLPGISHWDYQQAKQGNRRGIFFTDFCQRSSASAFLQQIESLMKTGTVLKDDTATRVVRCSWNGRDIVIKRYNYQGSWHALRHMIKGSRAQKSWRFGHLLMAADIPCAAVLGKIEERFWGIIKQSYIINEFIAGPLLYDVMNRPGHTESERQAVMEKSGKLIHELGRHHLTHGDMKPANMIICKGQPFLIDLDSMERHRIGWYFRYRYNKMVRYFHNRLHRKSKKNTRN